MTKMYFEIDGKKYYYELSGYGTSIGYEYLTGRDECYNEVLCHLPSRLENEDEAKVAVLAYNMGLRNGTILGNKQKIHEIKKVLNL